MATHKVMKNLHFIIMGIGILLLTPVMLFSQEQEKEIKLKIVKDVDGEETVIDTTIKMGDLIDLESLKEVNEILKANGLEDVDIDLDHLDEMVKDLDIEVNSTGGDDGNNKKIVIVKKKGEAGEDVENRVMVRVMEKDSLGEGKRLKVKADGKTYSYVITSDDTTSLVNSSGKGSHVIMFTDDEGNVSEFITGGEDFDWVDENMTNVEVIGDDNGRKVIVTDADGTTKEYELTEGNGTYMIGEDGEITKVGDDVEWVGDDEGLKHIIVEVGDNNEAIMITDDGKVVELKDFDSKNNMVFWSNDGGESEEDVFVEVIEKKEGDKTIVVRSKIKVRSVGEEDARTLEKNGVKINPDEGKKLDLEKMVFQPNPSDGKFTLEFNTPEKKDIQVLIYDINGKKVYEETVRNFEGHYSKEIDISSEKSGAYFLKIVQGDKMISRKIILE